MSCSSAQQSPKQILAELVDILGWQSGGTDRDADEQRVNQALADARAWLMTQPEDPASRLIADIVCGLDTSDDALVGKAYWAAHDLLREDG